MSGLTRAEREELLWIAGNCGEAAQRLGVTSAVGRELAHWAERLERRAGRGWVRELPVVDELAGRRGDGRGFDS